MVIRLKASYISTYYPKLYHMAESGSWESIKEHGLLSTTALLDLFEINGKERLEIESTCRKESVPITHSKYGKAIIRDQKPLKENNLAKLLDDMSVEDYCRLLNSKTFFWTRKKRLEGLLNAVAYRNRSHTVLTIDTKSLVSKHEKEIWLSNINSGCTIFGVGRRGSYTFQKIADYDFEKMQKIKKENAIVELAVDYSVKDISDFVIQVEEWKGRTPINTIWKKSEEK
ncbi:MAG: DUF7002 family protein [archaeon]